MATFLPPGLHNFLKHSSTYFTDAVLLCEEQTFHVSRLLLSTASPFFSTLFSNQFDGDKEIIGEFFLPTLKAAGLVIVLKFIYDQPFTLSVTNIWCRVSH